MVSQRGVDCTHRSVALPALYAECELVSGSMKLKIAQQQLISMWILVVLNFLHGVLHFLKFCPEIACNSESNSSTGIHTYTLYYQANFHYLPY